MSIATAEAHDDQARWGDPQEYALLDRDGQEHKFTGWLLASESTEQEGSRRWTVLEGYRTIGGNYVLRTLGCSVEYHRSGSVCNTGEPVLGQDMDDDLEPCRRCRPPADYKDARLARILFDVEVEIPTVRVSRTPKAFIKSLHWSNGGSQGELSLVAFRLLRAMRRADHDIDSELRVTHRVD
jgi:hypothetical protein